MSSSAELLTYLEDAWRNNTWQGAIVPPADITLTHENAELKRQLAAANATIAELSAAVATLTAHIGAELRADPSE